MSQQNIDLVIANNPEQSAITLEYSFKYLEKCLEYDPVGDKACIAQILILKQFHEVKDFQSRFGRESLTKWLTNILKIANRRADPQRNDSFNTNGNPDEVRWRCRKWSLICLNAVYKRCHKRSRINEKTKTFFEWLTSRFTPLIIQTCMDIARDFSLDNYVAPGVLRQVFVQLNLVLINPKTHTLIRPDLMRNLLLGAIASVLSDPLYTKVENSRTRRLYDAERYMLKNSSEILLRTMCKLRLDVRHEMVHMLKIGMEHGRETRVRDAASRMLIATSNILLSNTAFDAQLGEIVSRDVVLALQDTHNQVLACKVLKVLSPLSNNETGTLEVVMKCLLNHINNKHHPRLFKVASSCLRSILRRQYEARKVLKKYIHRLTNDLICRANETKSFLKLLQVIFLCYPDQLQENMQYYANSLSNLFYRYLKEGDTNEGKFWISIEVLRTLDALVRTSRYKCLEQMKSESTITLVIWTIYARSTSKLLCREGSKLFLSWTSSDIKPTTWQLFPWLHHIFKRDGLACFIDMAQIIYQFATLSPQEFLANSNALQSTFEICEIVLKEQYGDEGIQLYAAKIVEVILLQYKGQLDRFLPSLIEVAVYKLKYSYESDIMVVGPSQWTTHLFIKSEFNSQLLQALIAAFWSNPKLFLKTLENYETKNNLDTNSLLRFFVWYMRYNLRVVKGIHDRKMSFIGISTLLGLPSEEWPTMLLKEFKPTLTAVLDSFEELSENYVKTKSTFLSKGLVLYSPSPIETKLRTCIDYRNDFCEEIKLFKDAMGTFIIDYHNWYGLDCNEGPWLARRINILPEQIGAEYLWKLNAP